MAWLLPTSCWLQAHLARSAHFRLDVLRTSCCLAAPPASRLFQHVLILERVLILLLGCAKCWARKLRAHHAGWSCFNDVLILQRVLGPAVKSGSSWHLAALGPAVKSGSGWFRADKAGAERIRLVQSRSSWCRADHPGSGHTKLVKTGPSWSRADQAGQERIVLLPSASSCFRAHRPAPQPTLPQSWFRKLQAFGFISWHLQVRTFHLSES